MQFGLIFLEFSLRPVGLEARLILCLLLVDEEGASSISKGESSGEHTLVEFALHLVMVFEFSEFEGLAEREALFDEFLLLVDEGKGIGEGVELSARVGVMADGFVFEIGVLGEEVVDEFGIEVLIGIGLNFAGAMLDRIRVFLVDEILVAIEVRADDAVFDEVLHTGFEVHPRPPAVVHPQY